MSVFMGVRIPDELAAKVDEKGSRSQVIINALGAYLDTDAIGTTSGKVTIAIKRERTKPEKMIIEKPAKVESVKEIERPIETPKPATPQRFSGCSECGGINGMHQKKCSKK